MNKQLLTLLLTSLLGTFAAQSALAQQVLRMRDGDTQGAKIAKHEVSRIAIEGARIRSVVGSRGDFEIQVDRDIGQIFIRPLGDMPIVAPINIFLTDDQGRTYSLILTAEDVPAESILIVSKQPNKAAKEGKDRSEPYQAEIKDLVVAMATNNPDVSGYEIEDVGTRVPIWREADLTLERVWRGEYLVGERYSLVNVTNSELRLDEHEFMRRGVLAIAIDNHALLPRQATGVYVIREVNKDGK